MLRAFTIICAFSILFIQATLAGERTSYDVQNNRDSFLASQVNELKNGKFVDKVKKEFLDCSFSIRGTKCLDSAFSKNYNLKFLYNNTTSPFNKIFKIFIRKIIWI